ncbi:PAS/PAC sensor signal transduction histidine kinase [Arcobacter nitrofigilis DSM 7299]|uniref:histidine kinase n=1 Tax=Arcobacter nitrofigilis (strain ATCC 33309 / DSM 7299 / CCUG 15893 / LMG 7604 / NCTC 12251 / CI) TaxID=572480 RepID=D5UZU2_ARCNC|nr:PAS domain S-box protein [Arcobacter nitrofigilis]ADG93311.1 PAS/PAC sensor signal transduction histidine kinase [Arcobacter nitrofigilis DSM 7299]
MGLDLEKLKNTNYELKEIINNSWDGIGIIDFKSKFLYVNDALSPILGYTNLELLASNFVDLVTESYKLSFMQFLKNNMINSYDAEMNLICIRKDTKPIYLKVTVSLMLNKKFFVLNTKDITKQISDDQILNEYVISSHTDKFGFITEVSDAFCKLTGYSKSELLGRSHAVIQHEDSPKELFKDLWDNIKSGKEWTGKIKNVKKNNDIFWVDIKIKPIYNKYGDITGFTALMFDITHTLEQSEKLLVQDNKLNIMAETIRTISHEWRQPLNTISIIAQKLSLDIDTTNPFYEGLKKITENVKTLSNTIEEFKSLIEFEGQKEIVGLKKLFETLIKPYKRVIDFQIICDDNLILETYQDRLVTVFNNLVQNSIEAMQKNMVEDNKKVIIEVKKMDDFVELSFHDNAGGIANDKISKIFEPYFSTKEEKHGVGLGLYIVKSIIEMHLKGTVEVSSIENETTIKIKLPIII